MPTVSGVKQTSGFDINEFKTSLNDHGYLTNSSFEVFVQEPPILRNSSILNQGTPTNISNTTRNLAFRIDQVRAPGVSLIASDINRYGIGPTQKMPYNANFSEVSISVLGDHFCEFWRFWYNWSRKIFEFNSENVSSLPTYVSKYKNEYSSTVVIVIYDHYGNVIQKINLFEAFPIAIREVPLSWGDTNLMRINVSIAYTQYVIEGTAVESNNGEQSSNLKARKEIESTTIGLQPTVVS